MLWTRGCSDVRAPHGASWLASLWTILISDDEDEEEEEVDIDAGVGTRKASVEVDLDLRQSSSSGSSKGSDDDEDDGDGNDDDGRTVSPLVVGLQDDALELMGGNGAGGNKRGPDVPIAGGYLVRWVLTKACLIAGGFIFLLMGRRS